MNLNNTIDKFVEQRKGAGDKSEDIDQTFFIATSTALVKTIKDISSEEARKKLKLITSSVSKMEELLNEDVAQKFSEVKINQQGDTFAQVYGKHLEDFLNKLNEKLNGK